MQKLCRNETGIEFHSDTFQSLFEDEKCHIVFRFLETIQPFSSMKIELIQNISNKFLTYFATFY